jgi:hypothetical protein
MSDPQHKDKAEEENQRDIKRRQSIESLESFLSRSSKRRRCLNAKTLDGIR